MQPLPSPEPEPRRPGAGAETGAAENPFRTSESRGSRKGFLAAACLVAALAGSAAVLSRRGPAPPPVPPPSTAPAAVEDGGALVPALPADGGIAASKDECWRPGPSLEPKLPEARWSQFPDKWRRPSTGGWDPFNEKPRAFPALPPASEQDLPPRSGGCNLPRPAPR